MREESSGLSYIFDQGGRSMTIHASRRLFPWDSFRSWPASLALILCASALLGASAFAAAEESASDLFDTAFAAKPDHVILYIIDGLSYKTWARTDLPVLKKLISGGALVEQCVLPPSEHPVQGPYAEMHSCSIPNPVMMAGTLFLTKETEYFPQGIFPKRTTAFVANTENYSSLNRFYHYSYQKLGPDPEGIEMALTFMKTGKPAFMRLHLQEVGEASYQILFVRDNVPWRRNIWAKGSPYLAMLKQADGLLERFLRGLEEQGILAKTTLVIMGDHGEADTGYHPPESRDAAVTSIILWGAGIKKGVKIPYAEHIDAVPTICALLGADAPKTSQGRVIGEALSFPTGKLPPRQKLFQVMLDQFERYRSEDAETSYRLAQYEGPETSRLYRDYGNIAMNFYGIEKFVEWPKFERLDGLLDNNRKALDQLTGFLEEIRKLK
jgi:hypothetical protein